MQNYGAVPTALQQWVDARAHLSKATQAYISATMFLESICTPLAIKSLPDVWSTVDNNLEIMEHDEPDLHRTQAALKRKRNSYASPISALPSELLASIFVAATLFDSPYQCSKEDVKRYLSHVCSRWRRVALEVCPIWDHLSLDLESYEAATDKLGHTEIELRGAYKGAMDVLPERGIDNILYLQGVIDAISPYIKHLSRFHFIAETVEQLQPLLGFWLEKGVPGSLTSLVLVSKQAALVFPETNPHLNSRLTQYIKHVEVLELFSVGLDWSTAAFDRIESLLLEGLHSTCCPTLAQLAQILSTCPALHTISLERIQISPTPETVAPQSVELEHLTSLSLVEVDIPKILSLILPGHNKLDLTLKGLVDNDDMIKDFCSFVNKAVVHKLTLMISDARSNVALAQLLFAAMVSTSELEVLALHDMNLHESELNILDDYSRPQNAQSLPSPMSTMDDLPAINTFQLRSCIIHGTPEALHDAICDLPVDRIQLIGCNRSLATAGENNTTQSLELINETSEFGMRLLEWLPDQVSLSKW